MKTRNTPIPTGAIIESAEARVQELSCLSPTALYKIKGKFYTVQAIIDEMRGYVAELQCAGVSENYTKVLRERIKKFIFFQL